MASEIDASIIASTTQESTRTRGTTSGVWAYSRMALDGEDPTFKYCTLYTAEGRVPIFKTPGVPTNLRNHLKSKHDIIVEATSSKIQAKATEQLQQLYARAESVGQTDQIDKHIFAWQLDQDVIDEALVSLIVVRNLPFRFMEWPETHALFQVFNPEAHSVVITAHSQVKKLVQNS